MLPLKPDNAVFGIQVDGKPTSLCFQSVTEAEAMAQGFIAQGRKVVIVDRVTGNTIKRLCSGA
jgi:hypothetical protein